MLKSVFLNNSLVQIRMDKVTIVGTEDQPDPEPRGRAWLPIGIIGGIAVGLLIATGAQQNSPDPNTPPSTIPEVAVPPTVPTTTTVLAPSRLDILVDGYEGTLYLAGFRNDQGVLWRWESRTGTALVIDIPERMRSADFNSSRVRIAAAALSTVSPGWNLWVGTPENAEPIALSMTSWAWHATDPGRIAWIELDQSLPETLPALLRTATLPTGADGVFPIADDPADLGSVPSVVLFDDQGFLLQSPTDEDGYWLIAIDPDEGRESGRLAARYLGVLPDGDLLVSTAGSLQRASRDLTETADFPFPSDKRMSAIATSSAHNRWAIWEVEDATGVATPTQLWILDGEAIVFETTLPQTLRSVSWSVDGRWLIAAVGEPSPLSGFSSGQLWFIDTEDWSMHQVEAPGYIFAIAAVP